MIRASLAVRWPRALRVYAASTSASRRLILLVTVGLAAVSVKCGHTERIQGPESPERLHVQSVSGVRMSATDQRTILARTAQSVALALGMPEVRGQVHAAIRESPFREHKLHLRAFLTGSGRQLLGAMAAARGGGITQSDVLASLDSAIDLEFYMPVRQHRERWKGDSTVIVATTLRDHELPVAYDIRGNRVTIESAETPPEVPALVLVPVEIDFSLGPANGLAQVLPEASAQLGGPCPPNACMTYSYIPGDWEGWLMGEPEFETHVFVRDTNTSVAQHYRCTGAQGSAYYYDQNNPYWFGTVELVAADNMEFIRQQGHRLLVQVWEDDADDCAIKKDPQWLAGAWATVGSLFGGFTAVEIGRNGWYETCGPNPSDEQICWVGLLHAVFAPFEVFAAFHEDDYVGELVPTFMAGSCYNGNHVIVGGNGASMGCVYVSGITMVPPPAPPSPLSASISGPTSITSKDTYSWSANASGGSGAYTYQWQVTYLSTGTTNVLGTAQSQSLTVYSGDGRFEMSVSVTSNGTSQVPTLMVQECIISCERQ